MGDLSTSLRNKLRDHVFRSATFPKPALLYVSLHTEDPGRVGSGEVDPFGGYARVQREPGDANWTDVGDGAAAIAAELTFPAPTDVWAGGVPLTHAGLWTALTGGDFLGRAVLLEAVSVLETSTAPRFGPGALIFAFD